MTEGTLTINGRTMRVAIIAGYADPIESYDHHLGLRRYSPGRVQYQVEVLEEVTPEELATRIREAL